MNPVNSQKNSLLEKAKRYSSIKYGLAIIEIIYLLILLFLFLSSGLSKALADNISKISISNYLVIPVYLLIIYLLYYALDFPLHLYHSFILEHRFSLSKQKISDWFLDQIKSGLVTYIISLIFFGFFYYVLKQSPYIWWLIIWLFWIFFSLILAKLVPVIIIPLFFKYKKLSDETLRQRIINLAKNMGVKILDVFEIDLSKKSLKANAAFVGIGSTKRVLLADTLKDKYSFDEIEVILAHEFSHYRLRHLLKLMLINSFSAFISFYLIFKTSGYFLRLFGFSSLLDIAALPVIFIYLVLFTIFMQPFENYLSRRLERNADILAIKTTGLREAFVSMMENLSQQNLADRNPHPIIKFFFFDHPPVDERIAIAKSELREL